MTIITEKQLRTAAKKTNIKPTDAQARAGNYKKATIPWNGLILKIENPRGSVRSGTAPDGKKWSTTMRHHYGYITRTNGYDGDPVDVFIGPYPNSDTVYIVNQVDPKTGKFDEHKCMIGFKSKDAAKKGYMANYERGWKGFKNMEKISVANFKKWARIKGKKNGPKSGAYKLAYLCKLANIDLDIDEGDILLTGRFKNKRTVVKDIGTDGLGQPIVNDRKLLTSRIEKLLPEGKKSSKTQALNKKAFLLGYDALSKI